MSDIAVICGATGALGAAIVDAFVRRGDHVIAVARSRAEVTELESRYPRREGGGFVTGDTADLTQRLSVDDLWERIDRVGVPRWVVNATGGFRAGTVAESRPDDFAMMLDLNLASTWWSCRAAARRMSSRADGGRSGGIVNVSSRAAVTADSGGAAYAVAKAGVLKLTEVLATELKRDGVRVNCVLPWVIDTPANRRTMPEKLLQKAVPPAEIAAVIAYLCSDAADAINGTAIPLYGR
ncbi:MAG TPA: SDR family NAD(P)-dependent oxidoreductase [Candidatus Dormibacteraeota bacterium]